MNRKRIQDFLHVSAVACLLLAGPALLAGCGSAADTSGEFTPPDPAKVEAQNKTMEDYMNSPEGKKANKAAK